MANDFLNMGIPVKLPHMIEIDSSILMSTARHKNKFEQYLGQKVSKIVAEVRDTFLKCETRRLIVNLSFLTQFDEKNKKNLLVFNPRSIISSLMFYLNVSEFNSFEELKAKCNSLQNISDKKILMSKFPNLYKVFQDELTFYNEVKELYKMGFSIDAVAFNYGVSKKYIEETPKIDTVRGFCKMYSSILGSFIDNFKNIALYYLSHPITDLNDNEFNNDKMEAYLAVCYLQKINKEEDPANKQRYLYYLTNYFNRHKNCVNTGVKFVVGNQLILFDSLYDSYIDVLVQNPTLRVVDYERDYFKGFTAKEVEEYMAIELSTAKANWNFLTGDIDAERLGRAIHNGVKDIHDKEKRKKTQEELKKLYFAKRQLFDETSNYRVAEGINTFDGYVAFIYPNGKVILERFFERRKDGSEVIANDQAIYVMPIDEFYTLTNLSKTQIIRDKLCKRYIHRGNWRAKVLGEIGMKGEAPNDEFQELVSDKKIRDV